MDEIRLGTIEKILLDLPGSSKRDDFSNDEYTVFKIDKTIIKIPNKGTNIEHLEDILQSQLEMSWWLVDYLFGQHGIK